MAIKKVKVRESTPPKVSVATVAAGLGTKVVEIQEISKEEAAQYEPIGSPVMMPEADKLYVCYFGSRMLRMYERSLDDVVGYRVLDMDEEPEFRKDCENQYAIAVRYYAQKK